MSTRPARGFRRLSIVAALAVYLLMVVGGVVRITESGLGCPDWPLCQGRLLPPLELTAIIEYTHRSVAVIGGLLVIAVAFAAWRGYRREPRIAIPALLVVALLAIQVPLGGLVVATELSALTVAFHLGMALLIFGCALATAIAANLIGIERPAGIVRTPLSYRALLASTLAALFVLLLTGALVVGTGVSHICQGWPLCGPASMIGGLTPGEAISMYHRYTVLAVSILVVATIVQTLRLRAEIGGLRRWAVVLGAMFAAQIAVGAAQVLLAMPTLWRVLHLATATGVWAALVSMMTLVQLAAAVPAREARPRRGTPSLRVTSR